LKYDIEISKVCAVGCKDKWVYWQFEFVTET